MDPIKLTITGITEHDYFGNTYFELDTNGGYQLPYEIEPTKGKHDFNICDDCQKSLTTITRTLTEKFNGNTEKKGFPFCCSAHPNLNKLNGFKRDLFVDVPNMVARKVVYTKQHITNNIELDNWYKSITHYIDWCIESFGVKVNNEKKGKRPAVNMGELHPKLIVGIGGSAGALNAYMALLDAMPSDTGFAFVIISHMNPIAVSQLAKILSRHTKMKVMAASMAMPIRGNHVYIIPPDSDLSIEKNKFKVISPRSQRNKQIDIFFISLAEAMGVRAIGIVLSGYDGDGTEGCKYIKAKGGKTFTQDMSAEVEHMPLSAQASGCVDFVMPLNKIPAKLKSLAAALKT